MTASLELTIGLSNYPHVLRCSSCHHALFFRCTPSRWMMTNVIEQSCLMLQAYPRRISRQKCVAYRSARCVKVMKWEHDKSTGGSAYKISYLDTIVVVVLLSYSRRTGTCFFLAAGSLSCQRLDIYRLSETSPQQIAQECHNISSITTIHIFTCTI